MTSCLQPPSFFEQACVSPVRLRNECAAPAAGLSNDERTRHGGMLWRWEQVGGARSSEGIGSRGLEVLGMLLANEVECPFRRVG